MYSEEKSYCGKFNWKTGTPLRRVTQSNQIFGLEDHITLDQINLNITSNKYLQSLRKATTFS